MKRTPIGTRTYVWIAGALLVAGLARDAWALPTFGGTCSGCHTTARDAGTVSGNTGTLNPAGGSGTLKEFDVAPGGTVALGFNVTNNGGNNYAVALLDLGGPGLNSHVLNYTPDPGWSNAGSYFYTGISSVAGNKVFNLTVPLGTAPDIYTLRFNVGGGKGVWNDTEQFYLRVIPEPATMAALAFGGLALLKRRRRTR